MFKLDLADVRPSVLSLITVTLMAIIGITVVKFLANKFPVPGLTDLVNSV